MFLTSFFSNKLLGNEWYNTAVVQYYSVDELNLRIHSLQSTSMAPYVAQNLIVEGGTLK